MYSAGVWWHLENQHKFFSWGHFLLNSMTLLACFFGWHSNKCGRAGSALSAFACWSVLYKHAALTELTWDFSPVLANSNVVLLRLRALSELQQKALEACWRCLGGARTSEEGQVVLASETKQLSLLGLWCWQRNSLKNARGSPLCQRSRADFSQFKKWPFCVLCHPAGRRTQKRRWTGELCRLF